MSREVGLQAPDGEDLLNYWRNKAEQLMGELEAAQQMISNMGQLLQAEQLARQEAQNLLLKLDIDDEEEDVPMTEILLFNPIEREILEAASRGTLKQVQKGAKWTIKGELVDGTTRQDLERRGLITRGVGRYFVTDEGKRQLKKARSQDSR